MPRYSIGLDFGTNSVRTLIVDVADGTEISTSVWDYRHGEAGVILDPHDPHLARQHPQDYIDGIRATIREALELASAHEGFRSEDVIGIGVDTTGSTPLPVDASGTPLALQEPFAENPAAMAWLWKDHTGFAEASAITAKAEEIRPEYLCKCGGTYSSEWFWSKIWHCLKVAPEVFEAAYTWVEIADWIPALLSGTEAPDPLKRGICAAGHKAMFHNDWGGYPDEEFLNTLDPRLAEVRRLLPNRAYTVADAAGVLTEEWAGPLDLSTDVMVAVGAFDAHLGGVGSGISENVLVKIMGTSTCDMMVWPLDQELADIPGLCGIVPESILPGHYGLEAGQSAVGDIFNWFVSRVQPGGAEVGTHEALTEAASALKPGKSGLLGLDWHNGNRTVLVDQRLTGALVGMTLHTTPAEIYRALIESTAYGARVIMERFEEYGLEVERVLTCGGISFRSPLTMQIYADVMGRAIEVSRSEQTCALGAAMAGAVVAGAYPDFSAAVARMTGICEAKYTPNPENVAVYNRLYELYRQLHDVFGTEDTSRNLYHVMKQLLNIRDEVVHA